LSFRCERAGRIKASKARKRGNGRKQKGKPDGKKGTKMNEMFKQKNKRLRQMQEYKGRSK